MKMRRMLWDRGCCLSWTFRGVLDFNAPIRTFNVTFPILVYGPVVADSRVERSLNLLIQIAHINKTSNQFLRKNRKWGNIEEERTRNEYLSIYLLHCTWTLRVEIESARQMITRTHLLLLHHLPCLLCSFLFLSFYSLQLSHEDLFLGLSFSSNSCLPAQSGACTSEWGWQRIQQSIIKCTTNRSFLVSSFHSLFICRTLSNSLFLAER